MIGPAKRCGWQSNSTFDMEPRGRFLIVNADDFGRSESINTGVLEAREHGIVTSASLMVRWPAAAEAAACARHQERFSLGLHIDMGEWSYREGDWVPAYSVVPLREDMAVESEVWAQISTFRQLVGRDPTHLDSHQHVHLSEPVADVVRRAASELGVPLRHNSHRVKHLGDFYGQTQEGTSLPDAVSAERLVEILRGLPSGITELGCHPGSGEIDSDYGKERALELEALCDERVRAAIEREGIVLCSFSDIVSGC